MKRLYALSIAGGRGERLKPITDDLPKSMVPVDGRPLIERQAAWFVSQGVTDVVFLCGYLGEKIQDHFQDGARFGFRAHYSFEETPLGRGGAVRKGLGRSHPPSRRGGRPERPRHAAAAGRR